MYGTVPSYCLSSAIGPLFGRSTLFIVTLAQNRHLVNLSISTNAGFVEPILSNSQTRFFKFGWLITATWFTSNMVLGLDAITVELVWSGRSLVLNLDKCVYCWSLLAHNQKLYPIPVALLSVCCLKLVSISNVADEFDSAVQCRVISFKTISFTIFRPIHIIEILWSSLTLKQD